MPGVILTFIEHPEVADRALSAAARLAGLMGGARIEVLAIRVPPEATIMPTEEVLTRKYALQVRARGEARIAALKAAFDAWSAAVCGSGVSVEWCDVEGIAGAVVEQRGRRADFIVLKRPGRQDDLLDRQAIHAALFDTDRPVLVVPPEREHVPFGRKVAIAWRDDRFTIKAVLAGLRVLANAERVFVLAGAREDAPRPEVPPILAEHGIAAELHVLPIGAGVFGQALLAKAREREADMLVLGAYVHRARSLILGGVTRHVLAEADMPVLMRH
ncbi:MAG: universal stress protein [Acetobacteraceae bacterium]|nr:universal stress protein [Acetobacteraceae bacterium]